MLLQFSDTSKIARKLAPRGSRNVSSSSEDTTLYEKINERVTHMLKYELGPLTIIISGKKKKTAGVLYTLNFFEITQSDNEEVVPHLIYLFVYIICFVSAFDCLLQIIWHCRSR